MKNVLENMSVTVKLRLAYGICILVLFCVCKSSALKSIVAYSAYNEIQKDIERLSEDLADTAVNGDAPLSRELDKEPLLTSISRICTASDIKIDEMTQTQTSELSGFQLMTAKIQLEGGYYPVLKLLNDIENNSAAAVQSIVWKMVKVRPDDEPSLKATLYLKYAQHGTIL